MIFAGPLSRLDALSTLPAGHQLVAVGGLSALAQERLAGLPRPIRDRVWHLHSAALASTSADKEDAASAQSAAVLDQRALHGRVTTIEGLRVAGLGGVFRDKIWMPRSALTPPRIHSPRYWTGSGGRARRPSTVPQALQDAIWPNDWQHLARFQADVLLTQVPPASCRDGFVAVDILAQKLGASLIVCGTADAAVTPPTDTEVPVMLLGPGMLGDLSRRVWAADSSPDQSAAA